MADPAGTVPIRNSSEYDPIFLQVIRSRLESILSVRILMIVNTDYGRTWTPDIPRIGLSYFLPQVFTISE